MQFVSQISVGSAGANERPWACGIRDACCAAEAHVQPRSVKQVENKVFRKLVQVPSFRAHPLRYQSSRVIGERSSLLVCRRRDGGGDRAAASRRDPAGPDAATGRRRGAQRHHQRRHHFSVLVQATPRRQQRRRVAQIGRRAPQPEHPSEANPQNRRQQRYESAFLVGIVCSSDIDHLKLPPTW